MGHQIESGARVLKRALHACWVAAIAAPGFAHAASVYPGCAVPTIKPGHRTFFIDPVKGSKSGDGSAAKPWRTLAEVLDNSSSLVATQGHNGKTWANGDAGLVPVNPKGVIKPGDVIMLMSGDHGTFKIQNNYNSDFITVMAAPGQTPVVRRMAIVSAGKWLFQGIKFQGLQVGSPLSGVGLVTVGQGDWLGASQDIVLDNNSFSATDDATAWSPSQWLSSPYSYGVYSAPNTSCVAVENSHFYNVLNGIAISSDKSLVQANLIEKMANDGLDFMASNLLIKGNTIRDGVNNASTSPLHADGMQGWSLTQNGKPLTNKNIQIDSNTIIKTGITAASYLQGISIFDGLWDGVTISNNVVVTNAFHGIAAYGVDNARIINNTVVASDPATGTWITVTKSKNGKIGSGVVVRNNIAPVITILAPNVTFDHNIVSSHMAVLDSSGSVKQVKLGAYGQNNIVSPSITGSFVAMNLNSKTFDLRPKAGSTALNFGAAQQAPLVDIVGRARKPSITAGAYN